MTSSGRGDFGSKGSLDAPSPNGLLATVRSSREAWMLCRAVRNREDFATCNIFDSQYLAAREPSGDEVSATWARTRARCTDYALTASQLDRLEHMVVRAPPVQSLLMMHVVELAMADAAFILVLAKDARHAHSPEPFVDLVATTFDRSIARARCSSAAWTNLRRVARRLGSRRVPPAAPSTERLPALARPSPTRLARSLDHDLLTATLGE